MPGFLQTGSAKRDVSVISPRESDGHGRMLWLLLNNAYGLVSTNTKWQCVSNQGPIEVEFTLPSEISQLFLMSSTTAIAALLAKLVHDSLICGHRNIVDNVVNKIEEHFNFRTTT